MKKSFGFTLSEVLIVVAIIGVIAALTIPNIVSKFQNEAQVTQIRKIAYEFEQAAENVTVAQGKTSFAYTDIFVNSNANSLLAELSTTGFNCGDNGENCFASSYKSIKGTTTAFSCAGDSKQLESSASVCVVFHQAVVNNSSLGGFAAIKVIPGGGGGSIIEPITPGDDSITPLLKRVPAYIEVYVDTNGPKSGPNTGGRDMFQFFILSDGTISGEAPKSVTETIMPIDEYASCKASALGINCYKLLEADNWKMNY